MNNATSYAMMSRANASSPGNFPTQCFVDQAERVYSVAGDTWMSTNLGVSFTRVQTTSLFPPRVNFAGVIYSPTPTTDTMVVMGGERAADAWASTNGGLSWTVLSSSLPWGVRGNMNLAVSQNLVFVMQGGDCRSDICGPRGYGTSPVVYNDVWLSVSGGSTWMAVNTNPRSAPLLSLAAITFDKQGFMYLVGGQGKDYGTWTSAQYVSSQSLLTIRTWAPQLNQSAFTPPTTFDAMTTGAWSLGGPKAAPSSVAQPQSSYVCGAVTGLPQWTAGAAGFDLVPTSSAIYGTADVGISVIPAPLVYEVPYTNSTYGTYWQGNQWAVAPVGSWVLWGSNPDVLASTNQGQSWVAISGVTNAGFPNSTSLDYTQGGNALLYNAECGHRATYNRFYLIGDGNPIGTYTVAPLYNWASDDGLTWTQVMDNATAWAMGVTPDISSGQCVVGVNDVVYYVAGAAMWQSTNLGTIFTPITPSPSSTYLGWQTLGARESHAAVIYSPTPNRDTIVVMGGGGNYKAGFANDVWATTDYGLTWSVITTAAAWAPRQSPQVAMGMNGVMALYGGMAWTNNQAAGTYGWSWFSDMWLSLNGGSQWHLMTAQSSAGARAMGAMLVDSSGYLYVTDGEASWSNWLSTAYRSRYSLYNVQQWLPLMNTSITVPATVCPTYTPGGASTASPSQTGGATGGDSNNDNPSPSSSSSSSSSLSNGAIAGIVIGSVVGALLLCAVCFVFCRGRAEKKSTSYETQSEDSRATHAEEETHTGGGVEMS